MMMVKTLAARRFITPVVLAVVHVSGAHAQTSGSAPAEDDWTLARTDEVTAAYLRYESGLNLVVRCVGGRLESWIGGLPEASEEARTRTVAMAMDRAPDVPQSWYVGRDRATVVSTSPARFARWLREGGSLNIALPGAGEGGRNLRYIADLPPSATALDETLNACGKPSVDPRDADIDTDAASVPIRWARQPRPRYPDRRVYEWGFASASCLTRPDGRLEQCEIESEHPARGGFGAATLQSLRDARLETDGDTVPRRVISFTVRFQMGGEAGDIVSFGAPTRLRQGD